jgi:hypothetical protein
VASRAEARTRGLARQFALVDLGQLDEDGGVHEASFRCV